jgi:hypothetical protein
LLFNEVAIGGARIVQNFPEPISRCRDKGCELPFQDEFISTPIREIAMKAAMKLSLSIAVGMIATSAAGAIAAELPGFAENGFPISPVQLQVVGATNVAEMSPVAADGLLASPHQVSVLAPRAKRTAAVTVGTTDTIAR